MYVMTQKKWTETEEARLRKMAKEGTTTERIAKRLNRSVDSVTSKASREGVSLLPKDK